MEGDAGLDGLGLVVVLHLDVLGVYTRGTSADILGLLSAGARQFDASRPLWAVFWEHNVRVEGIYFRWTSKTFAIWSASCLLCRHMESRQRLHGCDCEVVGVLELGVYPRLEKQVMTGADRKTKEGRTRESVSKSSLWRHRACG